MPEHKKNLSDTRGNAWGIGFFKVCLRIFGARFCCAFIWIVAFFYACFDFKARRCAFPYIRNRFPNAGSLGRWWHCYRLLQNQGRAVFLAHWIRSGHQPHYEDVIPPGMAHIWDRKDKPFILLLSHVGCWQAAIPRLNMLQRPISLLIQGNQNPQIAQVVEEYGLKLIFNSDPFGGMLKCTEALDHGEIIALTGDRMPADAPHPLKMTLHGHEVNAPQLPWLLSARYNCPVLPVFPIMTEKPDHFRIIYAPPITVDFNLPHKPSSDVFIPYLEQYQNSLETIIEQYPYQIFHYDNF